MFIQEKTKAKSSTAFQSQLSSPHPSEMILFTSSTPTSPRTEDKLTESNIKQVSNIQLNLGELVEPWQESQESQVQVPTDPDRELSVTCAEREECTLPSRHGEDGTEK